MNAVTEAEKWEGVYKEERSKRRSILWLFQLTNPSADHVH